MANQGTQFHCTKRKNTNKLLMHNIHNIRVSYKKKKKKKTLYIFHDDNYCDSVAYVRI